MSNNTVTLFLPGIWICSPGGCEISALPYQIGSANTWSHNGLSSRVWTGTCLKYVLWPLQQFSIIFLENFQSFFNFWKTLKIIYFAQTRLQTLSHNFLECRTKVNTCFCTVKWPKKTLIIYRGFCRDPLPCSGFILYLHFAGGKSSARPLLYKPYFLLSEDIQQVCHVPGVEICTCLSHVTFLFPRVWLVGP